MQYVEGYSQHTHTQCQITLREWLMCARLWDEGTIRHPTLRVTVCAPHCVRKHETRPTPCARHGWTHTDWVVESVERAVVVGGELQMCNFCRELFTMGKIMIWKFKTNEELNWLRLAGSEYFLLLKNVKIQSYVISKQLLENHQKKFNFKIKYFWVPTFLLFLPIPVLQFKFKVDYILLF